MSAKLWDEHGQVDKTNEENFSHTFESKVAKIYLL